MPPAKSLFTKGVSAFQAGTYQDALRFFTEALGQDNQRQQLQLYYSIYDSRAATYEKLNHINDALRDCKSAMELAPARWQAYARAARLLLQTQRFDAAAKMADRALTRLYAYSKQNNVSSRPHQQRCSELESIKATALRKVENKKAKAKNKSGNDEESQQPCYISSLPAELLIEIFSLAIAQDHTALACAIIRVCRCWRRVAWDCPTLWSTLVLGKPSGIPRHEPKKKANVWLSRSKGHIRDLRIYYGAVREKDWRHNLELELKSLRWGSLRALTIPDWDVIGYLKSASLEAEVLSSLEKLEVKGLRRDGLLSVAHNLTEMTLKDVCCQFESIASRTLRHISIKECEYGGYHIFKIFELQPLLETLIIDDFSQMLHMRQWNPATKVINLNLTHIDVSRCYYVSLEQLVAPNLRVLRVSLNGGGLIESFAHLATLNLQHFEELTISQACCESGSVVEFLKTVPTLTRLEVKGYISLATEVIDALVKPSEGRWTNFICPRLQHVDVSQSSDIKTSSLVRLVKSRLPDGQEDYGVAPIQSLIIDRCPRVESDILPWFRQHVPMVSCVYLSKRDAAWRR